MGLEVETKPTEYWHHFCTSLDRTQFFIQFSYSVRLTYNWYRCPYRMSVGHRFYFLISMHEMYGNSVLALNIWLVCTLSDVRIKYLWKFYSVKCSSFTYKMMKRGTKETTLDTIESIKYYHPKRLHLFPEIINNRNKFTIANMLSVIMGISQVGLLEGKYLLLLSCNIYNQRAFLRSVFRLQNYIFLHDQVRKTICYSLYSKLC